MLSEIVDAMLQSMRRWHLAFDGAWPVDIMIDRRVFGFLSSACENKGQSIYDLHRLQIMNSNENEKKQFLDVSSLISSSSHNVL